MFKNWWRAIAVALPCLGLSAYLTFLLFVSSLEAVYEDVSPCNKGKAIFYSPVNFRGTDLNLWVRDYGGTNQPYFIACVEASDAGEQFGNAVWSTDGTVIAAYGGGSINGVSPQGYDFQKHVKVEGPDLEKLLARRGGAGKQVFSDAFRWHTQCRHPWLWEILE